MTDTITVLRPDVEEAPVAPVALAPRRHTDANSRVVLIDNGKPKAKELLTFIAEELRTRVPLGEIELISKGAASYPLPPERTAEIAARADLVITGLGDCGACSACSLNDALQFEALGVPATVLITEVFVNNVARFAENLGHPGYHMLVVPHPVYAKTDDVLRQLAANIADVARDQLVAMPEFASV